MSDSNSKLSRIFAKRAMAFAPAFILVPAVLLFAGCLGGESAGLSAPAFDGRDTRPAAGSSAAKVPGACGQGLLALKAWECLSGGVKTHAFLVEAN